VKKPTAAALIILGLVLIFLPHFNFQKSIVLPKENSKITSGWREYKSSEYHFSFKYPEGLLSNFQVNTTGKIGVTLQQLSSLKDTITSNDPNAYNVFFEADGWKSADSLDEFIKANLPETKGVKRQKIKVGNIDGIRISNLEKKADAYYYYNLFKNGDYVYNFAIFADNAEEIRGNTKLLDDIIGTIKFTN